MSASRRAVTIDSSSVLVRSVEHLAAVIGLDNVTVVATGDAVLVTYQSQPDKVKQLVEQFKVEKHPEATQYRRDVPVFWRMSAEAPRARLIAGTQTAAI